MWRENVECDVTQVDACDFKVIGDGDADADLRAGHGIDAGFHVVDLEARRTLPTR